MDVVKQCFSMPYLQLSVEFTLKNYCIKNFFISNYDVPDGDDSRVGVVILKVDCEGDATVEYVTAVFSVDNVGTCTFFVRGSTFVPYKINDHL